MFITIHRALKLLLKIFISISGRFGNQADHFLGALAFAKGLNRTLVLPPWVEYRAGQPKSVQVPFDTYFDIKTFERFHRVLTMEHFFEKMSDSIWPPSKRISFCYAERQSYHQETTGSGGVCNAKNGNPFGPFWDTFHVDFIGSQTYGPLHYDVHYTDVSKDWNERFPAKDWPVLAFTGAPAPYPVQKENVQLHQYLKWNEEMYAKSGDFVKNILPKGPFIGIHLRNGVDWVSL
jgi:peptide-O-fucosyltransferase